MINGRVVSWFNAQPVINDMSVKTATALRRFGAYCRTVAKRSFRKKTAHQKPGSPPRNKTNELKKFIYFFFDKRSQSVVIGPARLSGALGNAPESLEYGGNSEIMAGKGQSRNARIRPYPYMRPAFNETLKRLDSFWVKKV